MINQYIMPFIVFLLGLYCLTAGRRWPSATVWLCLFVTSVIIFKQNSSVELLVYISIFLPVLFSANIGSRKQAKSRHSSIQEKTVAYVAVLPTFGFYFLFRVQIEQKLQEINSDQALLKWFEVSLIVCTLLAMMVFMKKRLRV